MCNIQVEMELVRALTDPQAVEHWVMRIFMDKNRDTIRNVYAIVDNYEA